MLVHFDWSVHPSKRWMTVAEHVARRRYRVVCSEPAPPPGQLLAQLRGDTSVFIGFDVTMGIPSAYAERCKITSFLEWLPQLGNAEWTDFYTPATVPSEIALTRPFYPLKPGGTNKSQLVAALGMHGPGDLLRLCDQATPSRPKACEIFWTLGANQVGKAAISVWRDVLAPAVRANQVAIWPFAGSLPAVLEGPRIAVAEVYPGEIYGHLGIPNRFGKTIPEGRATQAPAILGWCKAHDVALPPALRHAIKNGFGAAATGEDQFDSLIGVLGMIEAVESRAEAPDLPAVRSVEGWILGSSTPGL